MSTGTDAAIADIARVALVTRRFHELRGLIPASFGGAMIVATLMVHAAGETSRFGSGAFQVLMFANCVNVLGMRALDRSYRQTFGDVVATPRQRLTIGLLPFVVMSGALCDMLLQSVSGQGPSIAAVSFASYAAWIAVRDWRWRIHYVAAAGAGLIAVIVTAAVPATAASRWWADMDPGRAEVYLLAYTLIGLGMVVAGLFDHRLLATALWPSAPHLPRATPPSRNAGLRVVAAAFVFFLAGGGFLWWGSHATRMALPIALMIAVIFSQVFIAVPEAVRAIREFNRGDRVSLPQGRVLDIGPDTLAVLFVLALAATVEGTIGARGLFVLTLALAMAWLAVSDWPHRKRYLIAAAGAAALALMTRDIEPARAFAMLVCAASVTVMLEGLFSYRIGTMNADTI
jgi:hypothetical protein